MVRYDDLTRYLEEQPADDAVSLTMAELEAIVGELYRPARMAEPGGLTPRATHNLLPG